MSEKIETIKDIELKIEEIDEAITAHNKIIHKLTMQRYALVSKKIDLEMDETIECAIKYDISPRRVMDLIIAEIEDRRKLLGA